jgi:biopolymer transport protein ExbB
MNRSFKSIYYMLNKKNILFTLLILFVGYAMFGQVAPAVNTTLEATPLGPYQMLKKYFIEGDWIWMSPVLISMIFGLTFCIERILTLNLGAIDSNAFLGKINDYLGKGDVAGAMKMAKETPGPVASLAYEGLRNADKGGAAVEKAIVNYGSVEMGLMEKGLPWISLFITLAPMLGFLGTVVGMIQAFEKIEAAGDISPTIVAAGIKVALLTTVFGLIVAMILQVFYNYLISKIDSQTNEMEEFSISFVESLEKHNIIKSA